jgi:hypothetical protein
MDVMDTRTREWRGAELPAVGGTAARAIAEIHAILANGGVAKGKCFLSEAGCRRALEVQVSIRPYRLSTFQYAHLASETASFGPSPVRMSETQHYAVSEV